MKQKIIENLEQIINYLFNGESRTEVACSTGRSSPVVGPTQGKYPNLPWAESLKAEENEFLKVGVGCEIHWLIN